MTNINEDDHYSQVSQQGYTDNEDSRHSTLSQTPESKTNSYSQGYVHGRSAERSNQEQMLAARDREQANGTLLAFIILATVTIFGGGIFWYLSQLNQDSVNTNTTTPVIIPEAKDTSASPQPTSPPENRTTIIERIREVPVPVPQQKAPEPQPTVTAPAPNINISVPNPTSSTPPEKTDTQPTSTSKDKNTTSDTTTNSNQQETPKTDIVSPNGNTSGEGKTGQ